LFGFYVVTFEPRLFLAAAQNCFCPLKRKSPLKPARFFSHTVKDHGGVGLISSLLPFGRLWYDTPDNAIGYAMHSSRSRNAVIRVYDAAVNVIETHEHKGDFKEL
jgi:hypothetical protein